MSDTTAKGIGKAVGESLAAQDKRLDAKVAALEARLAYLESMLGVRLPNANAPTDGAPARH